MIIYILRSILRIFSILVVIDVILSYFMDAFHPARVWLDRIVQPFLEPIRRTIPPISMIDISPIVLLLVIQVVDFILRSLA